MRRLSEGEMRELCLERDQYRCQAKVVRECPGNAWRAHHRKLRTHCSQAERQNLDNLTSVCDPCHNWIHANFIEACELGLRISSSAKISPMPLADRQGW